MHLSFVIRRTVGFSFSSAALSVLLLHGTAFAAAKKPTPMKPAAIACVIKGNINKREKIYHLPGCASYNATIIDVSKGERMFCSEKEAVVAGWRKAKNCPR